MKFIHRLGYYLGGVTIGIIILLFFLNGKGASCEYDYGPNARTVKNILSKKMELEPQVQSQMHAIKIDTTTLRELIKYGDVDFSNSLIEDGTCNEYLIENSYKTQNLKLIVKNCDSIATILSLNKI